MSGKGATPRTDPRCHGADVEASTRPRTATPLINHLGHRVVTALSFALCQALGTCRETQPQAGSPPSPPAVTPPYLARQASFWQVLIATVVFRGKAEGTFQSQWYLHTAQAGGARGPARLPGRSRQSNQGDAFSPQACATGQPACAPYDRTSQDRAGIEHKDPVGVSYPCHSSRLAQVGT